MILNSQENKERVLKEFLRFVNFDGWSEESFKKALESCEIEEEKGFLVFENGLIDLADFYIEFQNEECAKNLNKIENFHSQKIRDKIRQLLYARFEVEEKNKLVLQRLINFYVNPKNFTSGDLGPKPIARALIACLKISDFMWKYINDQSTDFNFYTKRLTLSKIILRSLLIFIKDDSKGFAKTKSFIDDQIDKVMRFEKLKSKLKKASASVNNVAAEVILDEKGFLKSPKEIIKNLPFFRLIRR